MKKETKKKTIDKTKHILIPKQIKNSEKEKKKLFKKYNITANELPRISSKDPAIKEMKLERGEIIKIIRKSPTAGETTFYRSVK